MTIASNFQILLLHKKNEQCSQGADRLTCPQLSIVFHPVYHISTISTCITGVANPRDQISDAPKVCVFVFVFVFVSVCLCVCLCDCNCEWYDVL